MSHRWTAPLRGTRKAFDHFLLLAESEAPTANHWSVNEEALKCAINSVYARPEFVEQHVLAQSRLSRVLGLTKVCCDIQTLAAG